MVGKRGPWNFLLAFRYSVWQLYLLGKMKGWDDGRRDSSDGPHPRKCTDRVNLLLKFIASKVSIKICFLKESGQRSSVGRATDL